MAGEQEQSARDPLLRLSLRTKALVIANEYTHRQMEPEELARVLAALAPTVEERAQVARAVEEELRAARYPLSEIVRLMGRLVSGGEPGGGPDQPALGPHPASAQGGSATGNEQVLITRKVRTPHLMPFESYEFDAPDSGPRLAPAIAAEGGARAGPEPAPPTQAMPVAEAEGLPAGPAAGGGPEGFSIERFRDLAHAAPASDRPKPVVLVADDDASARVMYRMKLEKSGFAVREARDGVDAWKQIKAGGIQFLVTDMKMPGYHGLEILGRMIDSGMTLPVVVVTAFDQLEGEFVVSTYPKLKFLTKPASPEQVAAAVSSFARAAARGE